MGLSKSTTFGHRDRCAIIGIGSTEFSKASGRSELTLVTQAALAAISDAGLAPADVDGVVRSDFDRVSHHDIASTLGLTALTYWGDAGPGGVAPCGMVAQAVGAILSGQASVVLIYRGLNGRSGRRLGQSVALPPVVGGNGTYDEFFLPYGLCTSGQIFALIARRHMIEFGTTSEDLARIAMACRDRANANPNAQMRGKVLTLDDYLEARMISSPLRLFDYCLESDGACAAVITAAERTDDSPKRAVLIRAVASGGSPTPQPGQQFPTLMWGSMVETPARAAAQALYQRAGIGPDEVDVAQIYDCFTISVLLQLEDWGFCGKGEAGAFVSDGQIDLGGAIPINTGGGHLSESYVHGMNHLVEGVRQIRGESTAQVPGAEICLVTSSPIPSSSGVLLRAA